MSRSRRRSMSDINVVPYIDVMLVLLVIFMVAAPLTNQGFEVELPQAEAGAISGDDPLILTVTDNGEFKLDIGDNTNRETSLEALSNRVAVLLRANPALVVLIQGDVNASYGSVIELLATLNNSGVNNVGLVTEAPEPLLPEG